MAQNVVFSLAPGRASNNLIDYNTPEGAKLFTKATEPMREPFDGTPEMFNNFISQVKDKVVDFGWELSLIHI